MNLVIDIGNSSAKTGYFGADSSHTIYSRVDTSELPAIATEMKPDFILISSVTGDAEIWKETLSDITPAIWVLNSQLPLPFINHYKTPHTLGTDRIASVAGAQALYPKQSSLVIDAGTCIKYEWLENGIDYRGGSISPGLHMRFQAMHTFTRKLPLLEPEQEAFLTGTTTQEAMQSGVIKGMTAEIEGIIEQYKQQYSVSNVIICGGDAHFFERQLKTPIFVVSELVLIGLNHILNHTIDNLKRY